jgi:hypothetical protein
VEARVGVRYPEILHPRVVGTISKKNNFGIV